MNKRLEEKFKNKTLYEGFEIEDLVDVINASPTLQNNVCFELFNEKELKIIRDLLEEVAYKIFEVEMKNHEILIGKIKKFDKNSVNKNGKHSKDKKLKVIEIKAKDKEDALEQLKDILPKDIYNRIKKEMI